MNDDEKQKQIFIGGVQKFTKDRDFAKFIEKTLPNYEELVEGISKKKNATGLIVRFTSMDSKLIFMEQMEGKMYKNRPVRMKAQDPALPLKFFSSMSRLLKSRENELRKPTQEEIKTEMDKPLKDKLIPYHNVAYEDQLVKKEEFLKDIFRKFVKRIETDVNHHREPSLPIWMTKYWNNELTSLNYDQIKSEESKGETKTVEIDKTLPCEFEDIIPCDKEYMKGYRNKVEFTVARNFEDNKICIGFNKVANSSGMTFVDYPTDLPHISDQSVAFAEKLQGLLREYEEKYGIKEFDTLKHEGAWRTMIYKESKRTGESLVSLAISRNSIPQEQLDEFKKDYAALWDDTVKSVSIIETDLL